MLKEVISVGCALYVYEQMKQSFIVTKPSAGRDILKESGHSFIFYDLRHKMQVPHIEGL
jgi:hypothetical protein